ncbi:glutathione hydrolase 1 proenzyme-like, partial [Antedon mediterranea]|uniref:glutathione hydrolase 1 proenzyme-like n=1 Tax=Antedon mediterranea TaxID=105859 RepID=UPI003AF7B849
RQFSKAAVATDVPECSEMGKSILLEGGTAVDAAITSMLCIGLVNGESSGISGGFFMMMYDTKAKKAEFLDARNTAPAATNVNMFNSKPHTMIYGALAIATPGEVKGMWVAHQKYGKLPWKRLFAPVIELARRGVELTIHGATSIGDILQNYDNGTRPKEAGDIILRSEYADTLQRIANNGWTEFYIGTTADMIIEDMKTYNGILTKADLSNYDVRWSDGVKSSFMNYTVCSPGSPSGGLAYQFFLNVWKGYEIDLKTTADKVRTFHRFLETCKFASGQFSIMGDVDNPEVRQVMENLASEDFASNVRYTIKDDRLTYTNLSYYSSGIFDETEKKGSTSHVSVLDENGNAVSVTTTINYYFGCKIMSTKSGIIYNNLMTSFTRPNSEKSYQKKGFNYPGPNKRPKSGISGSIFLDKHGDVRFVVGSSGGNTIVPANAWATLLVLSSNYTLKKAVEWRRIFNPLFPNEGIYEEGFPKEVLSGLEKLGHVVTQLPSYKFAVTQAILKDDNGIDAYSDSRKQGQAAGY